MKHKDSLESKGQRRALAHTAQVSSHLSNAPDANVDLRSKLSNPAVRRLFQAVENPFLVRAAALAVGGAAVIPVAALPTALLTPIFLLACAARDLHGANPVDNTAALRRRLEEEVAPNGNSLAEQLLNGASFSRSTAAYPAAARMNCQGEEVRIEYVPVGARFKFLGSVVRYGRLLDKTPSRAVVEWAGAPTQHTFEDRRNGKTVTIEASGAKVSSCALSTPVIPVHTTVTDEDRAWVTNAWKELTGVYD